MWPIYHYSSFLFLTTNLCLCVCAEPPPAITVPYNVTSYLGANAVLTCIVASTVHFNLTWQRDPVDARFDQRMRVTANLSLEVQRVTPDDAGWYTCIAANEGGISSSRLYLHVQGQCVPKKCLFLGQRSKTVCWFPLDMFKLMGAL